jgi:8-amino-7-oxononanoate synthase
VRPVRGALDGLEGAGQTRSVGERTKGESEREAAVAPTRVEVPLSLWTTLVDTRVARLQDERRWCSPSTFDGRGPMGVLVGADQKVVAFGSDDYLGLSLHPAVAAAAHDALDSWGTGSGASRLTTGSRPVHDDLEVGLAQHTRTEAAALFPSGLDAIAGALGTFADRGVRICCDEADHARIAGENRGSRADVVAYRHRDVDHLDAQLRAATGPALVFSEVVFSTDGDVAPVAEIASRCRHHGALLVLDEAHDVLEPELAAHLDGIDALQIGTLSTFGSSGGFVAGPQAFIELLVNRAPSYIYGTALTPPDAAAALAGLRVLSTPEGDRLRSRLAAHVARVMPGHRSPIIPIVLGSDERVLSASAALRELGVWVPAIGPPLVPRGRSRLRITLSAAHTSDQVGMLLDALDTVPAGPAVPGVSAVSGVSVMSGVSGVSGVSAVPTG